MPGWILWILVGVAVLYGAAALFLFLMQRRLIYLSSRSLPEAGPLDGRMPEDLVSNAEGGPQCRHWLWPPADADKDLIFLLQGNAGHIGHRLECYAFLVEAGYGLCLVGYRGYSGNPGTPDEAGLIADAAAALEAVKGRLPEAPIVFYGESLGAAVAVALAAQGERAPMILHGPFDSLASSAKHRYPWMIVEPLLKDKWDSRSRIAEACQPLLWLHGGDDPITPCKVGRRLYDAAPGPKTAFVLDGGGHLDIYDDPGPTKALFDWLERYGTLKSRTEERSV